MQRTLAYWFVASTGRKSPTSPWLAIAAGLTALFVAIPLVYIFFRAAGAEPAAWQRLLQARLWQLLGNTLLLVVAVTCGALVTGVSMAWLTERTDLPGRNVLRAMLALPLAIPAYIGGIVHLALLRPRGGLILLALEEIIGRPVATPSPLGFWGAAFILTLFTYPYVYLLSGAAFRSLHASLEEAARSLGRTPWQTFWQVTLPALRSGLMAGALLVALDILAEYHGMKADSTAYIPDEATIRAMYEAAREDKIQSATHIARRTVIVFTLLTIIAVVLFVIHFRWMRQISKAA